MPSVDNAYVYSVHLMGSPILLKLFVHDETAVRQVFQRIKQLEDQLTVNRAQSEVMSINHAAGNDYVSVSPVVFELIRRAKAVSLIENSGFNVAIGPSSSYGKSVLAAARCLTWNRYNGRWH